MDVQPDAMRFITLPPTLAGLANFCWGKEGCQKCADALLPSQRQMIGLTTC